jgi:Icc-related predicted phosphoesterase
MRLQLLSDLHFEFHGDGGAAFVKALDPGGVDVLVLAGDIAVGSGIGPALSLVCERYRDATVVYVHGNHEFFGADRASVLAVTRETVRANANLVWLDGSKTEIRGRRFLGGPLWFRHDPASDRHRRSMADFGQITDFESWVYDENRRMLELLDLELREGDIVVTHHLPTPRSVSPRFRGSPLNAFFVCDVEDLIRERRPTAWLHGHTHDSIDCTVGSTRLACNPFGYVGWETISGFSAALRIEV